MQSQAALVYGCSPALQDGGQDRPPGAPAGAAQPRHPARGRAADPACRRSASGASAPALPQRQPFMSPTAMSAPYISACMQTRARPVIFLAGNATVSATYVPDPCLPFSSMKPRLLCGQSVYITHFRGDVPLTSSSAPRRTPAWPSAARRRPWPAARRRSAWRRRRCRASGGG